VLQYFLLDRVLFGRREKGPTGEATAGADPGSRVARLERAA
jgi:hypothetical protein